MIGPEVVGGSVFSGNGNYPSVGIFQGNVGNFINYNRVLSPEEVLQNFNATKNRFGL